jgi:hypothetical protein
VPVPLPLGLGPAGAGSLAGSARLARAWTAAVPVRRDRRCSILPSSWTSPRPRCGLSSQSSTKPAPLMGGGLRRVQACCKRWTLAQRLADGAAAPDCPAVVVAAVLGARLSAARTLTGAEGSPVGVARPMVFTNHTIGPTRMNMPGMYQSPVRPLTGLAWPWLSYMPPTSLLLRNGDAAPRNSAMTRAAGAACGAHRTSRRARYPMMPAHSSGAACSSAMPSGTRCTYPSWADALPATPDSDDAPHRQWRQSSCPGPATR